MLHTYIPYLISLQSINFLHLTVSEIQLGKILKVNVATAQPKVKSRPYHDVAHLHLLSNMLHLMVSEI